MKKEAKLINGSVKQGLFTLAVPMVFGILSILSFNLIDVFFISKLGIIELAAISFTFPVVIFIGSIAMGLGTGLSAVVSRAIGEGNREKLVKLTTHGILLSIFIVFIFIILGFLTMRPVFSLLGAPFLMLPLIQEYMNVWYIGMIFLVVPIVGNNALRAAGNMVYPGIIMTVGATINAILDPILIFGLFGFPRMELKGAAIATVLARAVTLILSLLALKYKEKMIDFSKHKIVEIIESAKEILYIGIPVAITNVLIPLSIGVLTRIAANFGPIAVASVGVGTRIEAFALVFVMALSSILVPFIGQNLGADKIERICRAKHYSVWFSLIWGAVCWIFFVFVGRNIANIFTNDTEVAVGITHYLWIVPIGYGFQGIFMVINASFNAINKPFLSSALHLVRFFILYIPLCYLGARFFGLNGAFGGVCLSNILAGVFSLMLIKRKFLKC